MSNSEGHNVLFNLKLFVHKVMPTQNQHLHTVQASFGIYRTVIYPLLTHTHFHQKEKVWD